MHENERTEVNNLPESEITLDNLRAGKFNISELPRNERLKLENEEKANLSNDRMTEAWEQNWRPKHLFLGLKRDGSKAEWRDYEEFLELREKVIPIQNERLRTENQEQATKIAKLEAEISKMSELQRMQAERNLRKDKAEVTRQLQEYRTTGVSGDEVDNFTAVQQRKTEIEEEEKLLKQFEPKTHSMPQYDKVEAAAEEIAFIARNPWYNSDRLMHRYALGADVQIRAQNPTLSPAQHFRLLEEEIKKQFPEKFKSESSSNYNAPTVESGRNSGNAINGRASYITFEQLPKTEQERADQMIRLKIGGYKSRSDFMEKYNKLNKK